MKTNILSTALSLAAIASASFSTALAGSTTSIITAPPMPSQPSAESDWEFVIEPYLWVPALDGTVGILGRTTNIDFSISDLLDSSGGKSSYDIKMLFAMQLEARKGRWGIMADGVYVDLDIIGTPPTPRHLTANIDYTEFLGDLIGTYRMTDSPDGFLDLYVGARMNSLSVDINAVANPVFPLARDINDSHSETWVDPIIGLRGQWDLTEKVFVAGKADIGGFGVSSDFLWSARATLGYQFTEEFSTEIGYSYYDTDYENGGFTYDMAMGGLFLGFNFRL